MLRIGKSQAVDTLREVIGLVLLGGGLLTSAVLWLGLSSIYSNTVNWMVKSSASPSGSINKISLILAFAWSVPVLCLLLIRYAHSRWSALVFFCVGISAVVLGIGAITFLAWEVLYRTPFGLALWLSPPIFGYFLASWSFPALNRNSRIETHGLRMLVGLTGLALFTALLLTLSPEVAISDRPFW